MKAALHVPRIRWRRPPSAAVRLSALIVGSGSGERAAACIASLEREWLAEHRRACDLEILLAADTEDGIERAWSASSGSARDIVAVVRDDVVFLEGSLRPLIERLQGDPDCGAVAPRVFVDDAQQLQSLPRAWPSACGRLVRAAAERFALVGRWYARRRFIHSLAWWTTEHALASDALPEACLFQRRKAIERAAGLRDPRVRGDLERLDFCRRVARSGYKLVFEPRSRVVHSARTQAHAEKLQRSRFEPAPAGFLERVAERIASRLERRRRIRALERAVDLGRISTSPTFELGRSLRFIVEVTADPKWLEATGIVGEGPVFQFADSSWNCLGPGSHYVRAIDRDSGRTLGAWRFVKPRTTEVANTSEATALALAAA
ncbi:MAG: hypothetical protein JNL28_13095 [Planctomycetes bacterium]|nr:hypothetical protein [Planctomycetota bacterium]